MPSLSLIRPSLFASLPVCGAFTTREGGVSQGDLAGLNLGHLAGERPEHLAENWRMVLDAIGAREVALMNQVHGAAVLRVAAGPGVHRLIGDADAAICTVPGVAVAVRVADCVPVLLATPRGVAAVHSGWRGTAQAIVPAAVRALCEATGDPPAQVRAAVGPHIQAEVYEVGEAVIAALVAAGLPREVVCRPGARPHADLAAAIRYQLAQSGVLVVEEVGRCTLQDPSLWSYRRDGAAAGRQAGVVALCG
ncbi:MAG: laccase domain-containing protein [Deltaproteobacteria bacterium]|nr:laccase domain-containing protein [Deltaproteobacteria bacterium]